MIKSTDDFIKLLQIDYEYAHALAEKDEIISTLADMTLEQFYAIAQIDQRVIKN